MYTIGEVSEMFGLPVSTLRYYDKQGLFPEITRVSGIRKFSERELESLSEKGGHGDQGHSAVHGLVCRRAGHLPAAQSHV